MAGRITPANIELRTGPSEKAVARQQMQCTTRLPTPTTILRLAQPRREAAPPLRASRLLRGPASMLSTSLPSSARPCLPCKVYRFFTIGRATSLRARASDDEAARERRRYLACANVRRGEVSRARVVLTSAAIAPGTDETFAALSDPARRPPSPRQEVPVDRLSFQPDSPAVLTDTAVPHRLGEPKS